MLNEVYVLAYMHHQYPVDHPSAWGYLTGKDYDKMLAKFNNMVERAKTDSEFDRLYLNYTATNLETGSVHACYSMGNFIRENKPVVVYNKQEKKPGEPVAVTWTPAEEEMARAYIHRVNNPYSQILHPGRYAAWKWLKEQQASSAVAAQMATPSLWPSN